MPRLKGLVGLISGAGRGIGAACARAMAEQGARMIVTDLNEAAARACAAAIGPTAVSMRLDVRHEADWERVVQATLAEFGALHVMVNNAGVTGFDASVDPTIPVGPQDPEHATLETWRAVHATNLDGVFLGCKHAIRAMRANTPRGELGLRGSIINISSRSGVVGIPRAVAYASSKAAVRNHSKSVALYCAEERLGIRCNSVHPGAILTPMWEPMLGDARDESARRAAIAEIASDVPLRTMGRPEDVANLVVYLASDESADVTGAEFTIDGGILAGSAAVPKVNSGGAEA